jgi:hypothetical protein
MLSLNEPRFSILRNSAPLRGKKVLGRGYFSRVFEGSTSDTVFKLSYCRAGYAYMTDGIAPDGPYKPVLKHDFGQVSEVVRFCDGEVFPVYLIEMERLSPLDPRHPTRPLLRKLTSSRLDYSKWDQLLEKEARPLREFFDALAGFVTNFHFTVDGGIRRNYMQRQDGTMVANDPVLDPDQL